MKNKYFKICGIKTAAYLLLFILLPLLGCNSNSKTEKHPDFSKNIIDVSNKIVPVKTGLIFQNMPAIITVGNCLVITDRSSFDKGFLLFDKKTFKYLAGGGSKGQGPGQIVKYDNVVTTANTIDNRSFYAFDYSQLKLYKYAIDSILNNQKYLPEEVLSMNLKQVLGSFSTLNDSLFLGTALKTRPVIQEVVRFNFHTKKAEPFGYVNPANEKLHQKSFFTFDLSPDRDKYIQAFHDIDLMTICDIDGNLVCNIYGPDWDKKRKDFTFYGNVKIGKKYIIAGYLGEKSFKIGNSGKVEVVGASKLLVFDLQGNYLKTLNIGEETNGLCIDEENNRIILSLTDRDEPLGYLDLKGILD